MCFRLESFPCCRNLRTLVILVKFQTKPKKFFVTLITKSEDGDGDVKMKYMRRAANAEVYYFGRV